MELTLRSQNLFLPCTRCLKRVALGIIRAAERLLPLSILSFFLWPAAVAWALIEANTDRKALVAWARFPASWRPGRLAFFFLQTIGFAHSRLVYLWPHRLSRARWLRRCPLEADYDLEKLLRSERPIIFASVHFGPFRTLPYWLRAHGIAATTLVGRPVSADSALIDRLSPPADMPVLSAVDNMRALRKSLVARRRLVILMDVDRGRQVAVKSGDEVFRIASGAIRLAAASGAELVPCAIIRKGSWNFGIHFGPPVSRELLGKVPDVESAASHLLEELLPVIRRDPAQCRHRFLNHIGPVRVDSGMSRCRDGVAAMPCLIRTKSHR